MALYLQDETGTHHLVEDVSTGTKDPDSRTVETKGGESFKVPYHRINEATVEPGGDRCPKCFGKGS